MNCEQFELIKYLNRVQDDINTLINSIQEVSLAQASVLLIRNALTTEDIFTATSQANNIVNRISKGEVVEYSQKENGKPKSAGGDKSEKGPVSRLARTGDLLYNLSAKIHVYTNGIEISQQKIGSFSALNESIDYGGDFDDDEGADDGAFDDDGDEWTPHGPRTVKRVATKKTGKRKGPGSSGDSKRQRKESPRRGSPRRQPTEDLVFKQEAPDDDWDEDNSFADLPVGMIKQEQFDEFDQDLSESLDMMYDNQDQEDEDSMTSPSTSSKKIAGYPKGVYDNAMGLAYIRFNEIPFAQMMKYIIAYKQNGLLPSKQMSKNKRSEFRKRAKRYTLSDDGELYYNGSGKLRKIVIEREDQLRIMKEAHEGTGEFYNEENPRCHMGRDGTMLNFANRYFWSCVKKDVVDYVRNCEECQNRKAEKMDQVIQTCPICGQTRKTKWQMRAHMKYHSEERPFACHKCPSTFKQQSGLDYHLRVHNGEKSHWCPHCPKGFNGSRQLKDHVRIHTGEKPYLCTICGTSFARSDTLKVHLKQKHHTAPWEHQCSFCEKTFVLKNTLNRHLRTHTGERPFVCPHCNRAYSINYTLSQHLKENEVDPAVHCNTCGADFKWKCALSAHDCRSELMKKEQTVTVDPQSFNQQFEAALGLRTAGEDDQPGTTPVILHITNPTEQQEAIAQEALARVLVDKAETYQLHW